MRLVMHKVLRNRFILIKYVNSIGAPGGGGGQAGGRLITGTLHICVRAFQVGQPEKIATPKVLWDSMFVKVTNLFLRSWHNNLGLEKCKVFFDVHKKIVKHQCGHLEHFLRCCVYILGVSKAIVLSMVCLQYIYRYIYIFYVYHIYLSTTCWPQFLAS